MSRGIIFGIFWGAIVSILGLIGVSQILPQPDAPRAASAPEPAPAETVAATEPAVVVEPEPEAPEIAAVSEPVIEEPAAVAAMTEPEIVEDSAATAAEDVQTTPEVIASAAPIAAPEPAPTVSSDPVVAEIIADEPVVVDPVVAKSAPEKAAPAEVKPEATVEIAVPETEPAAPGPGPIKPLTFAEAAKLKAEEKKKIAAAAEASAAPVEIVEAAPVPMPVPEPVPEPTQITEVVPDAAPETAPAMAAPASGPIKPMSLEEVARLLAESKEKTENAEEKAKAAAESEALAIAAVAAAAAQAEADAKATAMAEAEAAAAAEAAARAAAAPTDGATAKTSRLPTIEAPAPADAPTETVVAAAPEVASSLPQGTGGSVKVNRLPSIGGATAIEPAADPAEAEMADQSRLQRNAVPFEAPEGKPLVSVLIIDAGNDAGGLDGIALATLPFPVTVAIDPARDGASAAAEAYRSAGVEVVILATGVPMGATASDLEVSFQTHLAAVSQAVAVIDLPEATLQNDRKLAKPLVSLLAAEGLGLITYDKGLNPAEKIAIEMALPHMESLKVLDMQGEDAAAIRRSLDRAAFEAGRTGRVLVVGHSYPQTIEALTGWAASVEATLALAPASALLLTSAGQ